MNEVILHGELGEKYGTSFRLAVRDAAEAFRALDCQLAGFRQDVRSGRFQVVRQMPNDEFALTPEQFRLGMDNCKLHFLPVIEGAANGKGVEKVLLGAALIATAWFDPFGSAAFFGTTIGSGAGAMTIGSAVTMLGIGLALGGLSLLIAPSPKVTTNQSSNIFSGNTGTTGQNIPIPLVYGGPIRVPCRAVATKVVTNEIKVGYGGGAPPVYYTNAHQSYNPQTYPNALLNMPA
jgi:predicted phage tail protein